MKFQDFFKFIAVSVQSIHVYNFTTKQFRIIDRLASPPEFITTVLKEFSDTTVEYVGAVSKDVLRIDVK